MQHISNDMYPTTGTFIYEALSPLESRHNLNVGDDSRTGYQFEKGDLISIDYIQPSKNPHSSNGPFLRLTDGRGWLFHKKRGVPLMKRLSVDVGLWCFWMDNCPVGQALRSHPTDKRRFRIGKDTMGVYDAVYEPLTKIYCDRRVSHPSRNGVNFYRVQGTDGWVVDKRRRSEEAGGGYENLLLEENDVMMGCFVYKALQNIAIRYTPRIESVITVIPMYFKEGNLVSVDAIVVRRTNEENNSGPFLRLADGSGWLFENQLNEKIMVSLPVDVGCWKLKVVDPEGMVRLRHPSMDAPNNKWDDSSCENNGFFQCDDIVDCDRRVKDDYSSGGGIVRYFYRVASTGGWVFDKRGNGDDVMIVMSLSENDKEQTTDPSSSSSSSDNTLTTKSSLLLPPWPLSYIRGMAAVIDGTNEQSVNEKHGIISFLSSSKKNKIQITVHYKSRTIGLSSPDGGHLLRERFRHECTNAELIQIMKSPIDYCCDADDSSWCRVTKNINDDNDDDDDDASSSIDTPPKDNHDEIMSDGEKRGRYKIMEIDEQIQMLQQLRMEKLKSIKVYDDYHHEEARRYKDRYRKRCASLYKKN